jgi:hypothetical protein
MPRLESALVLLLVAGTVASFWAFPVVPTQDGPAHLANAAAIREIVLDPAAPHATYFELNRMPTANWVTHLVLALLLGVVSPLVAEKLLFTAHVVFFALIASLAVRAAGDRAPGAVLLMLPFATGWTFHMVFQNFSFASSVFLLILVLYWRTERLGPLPRTALLAGPALLLQLLHGYVFGVALGSCLVLAAWDALRARRARPRTDRACLRPLVTVALSFLPGVLLELGWVAGRPADSRMDHRGFLSLLAIASRLESAASFEERELLLTRALLALFAAAVAVVLWRWRKVREITRADGFFLLALVLFVLYFVTPDWIFGVGLLSYRLLYFPFLALALWLAARLRGRTRLAVVLAAFAIGCGLLGQHVRVYQRHAPYITDYLAIAGEIEPGSTLLALTANGKIPGLGSEKVAYPIHPFMHSAGYVATLRRSVLLNNYEALAGTFPLVFRREADPRRSMGNPDTLPPHLRFSSYGQGQEGVGRIDYVLRWQTGPWSEEHFVERDEFEAILGGWASQLERSFERVATSPHGWLEVWRARS